MKPGYLIAGGILLLAVALWIGISAGTQRVNWTEAEITTLRSLWIGSLPPLCPDPSNTHADDPRAAALGQRLFFDTRCSSNGAVACSTCHVPGLMFTDKLPLAHGVGTTSRKTMTIVGTAYSPPGSSGMAARIVSRHRRWDHWKTL